MLRVRHYSWLQCILLLSITLTSDLTGVVVVVSGMQL